jgi:hypothetical protein
MPALRAEELDPAMSGFSAATSGFDAALSGVSTDLSGFSAAPSGVSTAVSLVYFVPYNIPALANNY